MFRRVPLRRITTWLAIIGYALVVSGLPLPVGFSSPGQKSASSDKRLSGKDRTKPFPCMDKPCGCATAEQCFANCCCHTPAERLAWAKAHRVDLAIMTALERRVATESACTSGRPAKKAASCCSKNTAIDLEGPAICSEYRSLAAEPADQKPADDEKPAESQDIPGRVVIMRSMLACKGIALAWASATVSLAPPRPAASELQPQPCVEWLAILDQFLACERLPPDSPPPRA